MCLQGEPAAPIEVMPLDVPRPAQEPVAPPAPDAPAPHPDERIEESTS